MLKAWAATTGTPVLARSGVAAQRPPPPDIEEIASGGANTLPARTVSGWFR